jgi:hypothetical protein
MNDGKENDLREGDENQSCEGQNDARSGDEHDLDSGGNPQTT